MPGQVIRFHDTEFHIVDANGEKWVTVKQVAEALGYSAPDKLNQLIRRNPQAFQGKTFSLKLSENAGRPETLVSYHGVIRIAMWSKAPKALEFQDWAEDILFKVMTTGHYEVPALREDFNLPVLQQILKGINETVLLQGRMLQNQEKRLEQMEGELRGRFSQILIPANRDITSWPTPTQRLRILIGRKSLPKGFNSRGHFDQYVAEAHKQEFGNYPEARCRRHMQKLPEHVVEPCVEIDDFLRRIYRRYMRHAWPGRQLRLKLSRILVRKRAPEKGPGSGQKGTSPILPKGPAQ